jgi:hypothetical protein
MVLGSDLIQRQSLILGLPPFKRPVKQEFQGLPTLILSADKALDGKQKKGQNLVFVIVKGVS